ASASRRANPDATSSGSRKSRGRERRMSPAAQPWVEPNDPNEKLTIRQAAELCGVSYDAFATWIRKGVVKCIHVGPYRAIRVYRKDVQAQIDESDASDDSRNKPLST